MKPANPAPFYACLYPALCDKAREHGYALAIHGTVTTDLDLIAVPWTTAAVEAETLMLALKAQLGAFDYREMLQQECGSWAATEEIDDMVAAEHKRIDEPRGPHDCALKPHGRKAWNLYLQHDRPTVRQAASLFIPPSLFGFRHSRRRRVSSMK